ncbi:hypothetical protein FNF27_05252 [Cafeteria roenbergensis]|uniref:Inositol polyphosphate-related phosphatase domain-containing protein n=2 Tax=Cafeteria roenbergensis TaxID=33653 RepID=A0A5A8CG25_CAFRO|nr:hypothetical protein FNF29_04118 [Cafeteria roenbergensis]KAA0173328.1 hypothetical protein FNF27_05252 [Cafeteria roenbergensis]|eukprot:KAA0152003.1 hypothetical protein FNF29_04118 [Cafeteria roenbergensis]
MPPSGSPHGDGAAAGYVTVPQAYVSGLESEVAALKDEIRGLQEDRARMASAMATLERLVPAIEHMAKSDPATAAELEATIGPLPRVPSILSPEQHAGSDDMDPASMGIGPDAASRPPPPRTVSDVRIWTGTWNLGAQDPFAKLDVDKNLDVVERVLAPFVPRDYDIYVLGVQEAVSDRIFRAVARFTGCYQLPLHAKLEPAKEASETHAVRSRRMGRAICVQEFIDDARKGKHPQRAASMTDMLDRVFGRGDGALIRPKFTGIAVFVTPSAAPYVRLLGVYKHSFGASEGSKGGVGVALGVYDSTMAFVTAHMASKRIDMRRQQYCDLVERLGAKLGGRGFHMTEEFHHVVWMGDLNYHCAGCSAEEAAACLRQGRVADLLLDHDELIRERADGAAFYDFEEPNMVPEFFPTYKRRKGRGAVDMSGKDPEWVDKVYELEFKEAAIKGGRTVERVPSWTDRIMFRSLPSRADNLLPESLDPDNPDAPHNYRCVNHGCDLSDHAPVFCTWTLRILLDPVDETLPEGMEEGAPGLPACVIGRGTIGVGPELLHPALRQLNVILTVTGVRVNYRRTMRSPRALSMLFPLPYEDGDDIPERAKIVRTGTLMSMSARSDSREGLSGGMAVVLSRANKLPDMHLLLKVSLEDSTKAQAVVSLRECGITDIGRVTVTKFVPLMRNGLRAALPGGGGPIDIEFTLEYHGHYASVAEGLPAGSEPSISSGAMPHSVAAQRLRQLSASVLGSGAGSGRAPAGGGAAAAAAAGHHLPGPHAQHHGYQPPSRAPAHPAAGAGGRVAGPHPDGSAAAWRGAEGPSEAHAASGFERPAEPAHASPGRGSLAGSRWAVGESPAHSRLDTAALEASAARGAAARTPFSREPASAPTPAPVSEYGPRGAASAAGHGGESAAAGASRGTAQPWQSRGAGVSDVDDVEDEDIMVEEEDE